MVSGGIGFWLVRDKNVMEWCWPNRRKRWKPRKKPLVRGYGSSGYIHRIFIVCRLSIRLRGPPETLFVLGLFIAIWTTALSVRPAMGIRL
jgi:hypothetical protein